MEKMVLKEGMSLFMNGNGPKPNLNELKKDLKTKIEAIKLVDKSEIKDDLVVINHFAKEILDELYK